MYYLDVNYKENGQIKVKAIPKRFTMKFPTYPY